MKYEWRKKEKAIYLPPLKPVTVDIPRFKYFTIDGRGNPNSPFFGQCIEALYAASYTVRMSHKKGLQPEGFFEYTVYPLEGFWDISEDEKQRHDGELNKDELFFTLMIRQPEFVDLTFAVQAIERAMDKKKNPLIQQLIFTEIHEGTCVQMMHRGSYDDEPESFKIMAEYCRRNSLSRKTGKHKEIYISDPRKTIPEKMKTTLRFTVE